jgi:hypothetical protein
MENYCSIYYKNINCLKMSEHIRRCADYVVKNIVDIDRREEIYHAILRGYFSGDEMYLKCPDEIVNEFRYALISFEGYDAN